MFHLQWVCQTDYLFHILLCVPPSPDVPVIVPVCLIGNQLLLLFVYWRYRPSSSHTYITLRHWHVKICKLDTYYLDSCHNSSAVFFGQA